MKEILEGGISSIKVDDKYGKLSKKKKKKTQGIPKQIEISQQNQIEENSFPGCIVPHWPKQG